MISAANHRLPLSGNSLLLLIAFFGMKSRLTQKPESLTMLSKKSFLLLPFFLLFIVFLSAQTQREVARQKIAVFVPLYLDSAFDNSNNYRFNNSFPRYINPGLEFLEGVQLALDSLNKEQAPLEVFIYDTRSSSKTLEQQLSEMDSVGLIIAYTTLQECRLFADAAKARKIPCINVNLPNDGGVVLNPYFVLLNATLTTHVEGIYRFLQKNYPTSPLVLFRKKGPMEDLIAGMFRDAEKNTAALPLQIKTVVLPDSFNVKQIVNHLDSNKTVVCISASLDEQFNRRLAMMLASVHKIYMTSLVGMPTLETVSKDFNQAEFRGPEFIYSTPFYNARTDRVSHLITGYFTSKMYARPSDMVLRGYETAWRFGKLLLKYTSGLGNQITRKEFNVFHDFDIRPVPNRFTGTADYYENKKLYFLKWQDGVLKGVY